MISGIFKLPSAADVLSGELDGVRFTAKGVLPVSEFANTPKVFAAGIPVLPMFNAAP